MQVVIKELESIDYDEEEENPLYSSWLQLLMMVATIFMTYKKWL